MNVYKVKNGNKIESSSICDRNELLSDILNRPNAGFHNSIYRGKDITDLFYNGTLSQQIANGTFDDIFIGDYIIGENSGIKYLVADINYRLHCGDTECTTPHVLMIPEKVMGTVSMNDSNTSTGAYIGSKMYTTNLLPFKTVINNDFGSNHILKHRNYLQNTVSNGYETGGAWYDSTIELMNELMVYGANVFHNAQSGSNVSNNYEIDKSQLSLFRLDKSKIIAFRDTDSSKRYWYWLRSVAFDSGFCCVYDHGIGSYNRASDSGGIRPCFLMY